MQKDTLISIFDPLNGYLFQLNEEDIFPNITC